MRKADVKVTAVRRLVMILSQLNINLSIQGQIIFNELWQQMFYRENLTDKTMDMCLAKHISKLFRLELVNVQNDISFVKILRSGFLEICNLYNVI